MGTSSNHIQAEIQNRTQQKTMTQAGLLYPLKTEFLKPTLYLKRCEQGSYRLSDSDSLQKATKEWSGAEAKSLTEDQPASQRCPTTEANDARIRTVPLVIHPESEAATAGHTTQKDEIEPVGAVSESVEYISQNHRPARHMHWHLIAA